MFTAVIVLWNIMLAVKASICLKYWSFVLSSRGFETARSPTKIHTFTIMPITPCNENPQYFYSHQEDIKVNRLGLLNCGVIRRITNNDRDSPGIVLHGVVAADYRRGYASNDHTNMG